MQGMNDVVGFFGAQAMFGVDAACYRDAGHAEFARDFDFFHRVADDKGVRSVQPVCLDIILQLLAFGHVAELHASADIGDDFVEMVIDIVLFEKVGNFVGDVIADDQARYIVVFKGLQNFRGPLMQGNLLRHWVIVIVKPSRSRSRICRNSSSFSPTER